MLVAAGLGFGAVAADEWKQADPTYEWSFPQDYWPHAGYRNEWWYFTGLLEDAQDESARYGYQFTIFRIGLTVEPPPGTSRWHASDLLMGHAAVTNLQTGRHAFSEILYRAMPELAAFGRFPDPAVAWGLAPAGSEGVWTLNWNGGGFDIAMRDDSQGTAMELSTRGVQRRLLQGIGGYSRKAAGQTAASHYYSVPDLTTAGRLQVDGRQMQVRGATWMDHEFSSNVLQPDQVGWDWFSLRFDDGGALMLFQLRDRRGRQNFGSGTWRDSGGGQTALQQADFELEPVDHWESPATGIRYPIRWQVRLADGRRFTVEAIVDGQENASRLVAGLSYWEGAVRASDPEGETVAEGYLEMTGYGEGTRPPL